MKTGSRLFMGAGMSALLVQAAGAGTASPACITSTELRAGMAFLVPKVVAGMRDKCKADLPRDAYLTLHGERLIARFKAEGMVDTVALKSLMGKVQPNGDIPSSANALMAEIVAQTLVVKMQATLKPSNCVAADRALALIDPLPAENVVGLFELVGTAIARGDARKRGSQGEKPNIQLCEALG